MPELLSIECYSIPVDPLKYGADFRIRHLWKKSYEKIILVYLFPVFG